MESETLIVDLQPSTREQVLAAVGPLLWVAISYVDPGKWAAALEGGAQFGFDLILLVLIINFVAILCHYLAARIAIVTGKNLAQICREEYDDMACILLGIQAEISMIMLDLTMVLGTAYGLNAVFGINLSNCVFLTSLDAILCPLFTSLLGNSKAKIFCTCLACFVLASCVSGILMNVPERSLSMGGILNDLTGENAYALMGILGANIMPHNIYLHSSIIQQHLGQRRASKGVLCHSQLLATFCVFSGIFLVNCMVINLAANVFYSSGLTSLTLQDAVSILDQFGLGFKSLLASIALICIMFFSNQLVAATWGLEKQVIANDFFRLDVPGWLHCVTIRIAAIVPALSCVWNSGGEGIFQLLIFAQVTVALLLPSSLIPLFRVASLRSIMGVDKISRLLEFSALLSFVGILGLNIVFVIELIFGSSDWVMSLKWNVGTSVPVSYLILLVAAFASLLLMLWLATTPLKSASSGVDIHELKWDKQAVITESDQTETKEAEYQVENVENWEPVSSLEKSFGAHENLSSCASSELNLPETLLDSETNLHSNRSSDDKSDATFLKPAVDNCQADATVSTFSEMSLPESIVVKKHELLDDGSLSAESHDVVEKTLKIEGDGAMEKGDKGDAWVPEELTKDVSESSPSLTCDGPGSFRSLGGKLDDMGSGAGSLSRLGRAARRQLTSILDEFWGQLFDFHGQVMPEAKVKRLDVLLGVDSKVVSKSSCASVKLENTALEPNRYYGGRGSDPRNSTFYSPSMHHVGHGNIGLSLGVQPGSPRWSNQIRLLDSYIRDSGHGAPESGERRYHSVHAPSSTEGHEKQPVTIHGLNMASYLSRLAKEKGNEYLKSQLGSLTQASTLPMKSNNVDSYSRPLGQKPQNGLRVPPGFHNIPVHRNSSLKFERPGHELSSPEPVDYSNSPPGEKKFHSLPNISGLYIPRQNSSLNPNSSQWDYSGGYRQSITRLVPENTTLSTSSWASPAVGLSQHSPTKVGRDAFSVQFGSNSSTGSLWSKQPYEQFGVADKSPKGKQETPSFMDMEAKLLQSFRSSIIKLLKLEGSTWLFRQNDGADEDLIDRVAARERFLYEVERMTADGSDMKIDEIDHSKLMSVPNCGDGCVWRVDLVVSFGVWCIHRILELSVVESRPELWGKYTYVLNRLQGIIDLAFTKNRSLTVPCFCLQLPVGYEQKSSWPVSNSSLPPQSKAGRGKVTTAPMLLDIIKDVELAISCRKGRSGTAAGDVAFPKGKENLASVLKRYKRRLSNKPVGQEVGLGLRKNGASPPQGL